jgi:hypothetical protein
VIFFALAHAEITPVDLAEHRNHDLFGGEVAPRFRMAEVLAWAPPVPLDFDANGAPDVVLLKSTESKDAPASVEIAIGRTARTVYVLTSGQGPLSVRDIVADGELVYADGRSQALKWMVGEQAWPAWAGATGRGADPVAIGTNAGGDLLTASLLTVHVAYPDAELAKLRVSSRPGALAFAVLAVSTSDASPATVNVEVDRRPFAGFDFRIPGKLDTPPVPILPAAREPRRVVVRDGHLAYEDGERARFWGINLVREGALPPLDRAVDEARSLAAMGFDLVRLHHIDGEGLLANPKRGEPGEPLVDVATLDRLDRFFAALKAEGHHVYLETFTLRSFRKQEGLPFPDGLVVGHKYASMIWPEYLTAKKEWVKALYGRVNPYTGMRYADDPAVALFEIANEDSLLVAWSGGNLEKLPKQHRDRLDVLWSGWLRKKYKNDAAIEAAWKGGGRGGLQLGETLSLDSIAREPSTRARTELFPQVRAADLVSFYSSLEAAHHAEMARFLREDLGFRAPLVCNTSFGVPVADALLAACDVVDLHIYWDPIGESNVFFDHALVERPLHGRVLERLSWCQADKPCTMSELGHTWPNRYGQEAPLVWAALLARQDLDAVMWFTYSHGPWEPTIDGPGGALDLAGRFTSWAQMPAAAALFRGGLIAPAARRFVRWWSPDALNRDLSEPPGLWIDAQVSWSSALDAVLRTSFSPAPPDVTGGPATPRPVRWWPDQGRYVIDTPTVQAIIGRSTNPIFDRTQGSPDPTALRVIVAEHAAVSLVSADGQPLGRSRHAYLTVAGRTERQGSLRSVGGPGSLVQGKGPALVERLTGFIEIKWPNRPVAWALTPTGERRERISVTGGGGWWRIDAARLDTLWVEVVSVP